MSLTLEELNKVRQQCNRMLLGLVGSQELVEKWWTSPNKAFGRTPEEEWVSDPKSVYDYIGSFCY